MIYLGKNISNYGIFRDKPFYISFSVASGNNGFYTETDLKNGIIKVFKTEKQLLSYYNRYKKPKFKHNLKSYNQK